MYLYKQSLNILWLYHWGSIFGSLNYPVSVLNCINSIIIVIGSRILWTEPVSVHKISHKVCSKNIKNNIGVWETLKWIKHASWTQFYKSKIFMCCSDFYKKKWKEKERKYNSIYFSGFSVFSFLVWIILNIFHTFKIKWK